MGRRFIKYALASATLVVSTVQAADVRINGFMSIFGGRTFEEGKTREHLTIPDFANPGEFLVEGGAESDSVYEADALTQGEYNDNISFAPDSNYGIQITADLGHGLTAIGQITGSGTNENFTPNISWAYLSYDLTDEITLQAGRQRLPLFYYSDSSDVGYSYHWIRPPQVLPALFLDKFEGVKGSYSSYFGDWDVSGELHFGQARELIELADFEGIFDNLAGTTVNLSNGTLTLQGSYNRAEIWVDEDDHPQFSSFDFTTMTPVLEGTEHNKELVEFMGLAAHVDLGSTFVVAEYSIFTFDSYVGQDFDGMFGLHSRDAWYISTGWRLGDFTPHITYAEAKTDNRAIIWDPLPTGERVDFESKWSETTIGLRYDFHTSAAFKVEYMMQSDKSDDFYRNHAGGNGYGNRYDVQLFTAGVDLVF